MKLRDRLPDPLIFRIYGVICVLSIAYGLAIALTPIVLGHRHLPETQIGGLAAAFGLGIVSAAIPAGILVQRLGAGRLIAVGIVGYALAIGFFPFASTFGSLIADRFIDGACSVCAWVGCETLLLDRAPPSQKAFATSLYALATASGYVIGPTIAWLLRNMLSAESTFVVAGAIALGAGVLAWIILGNAKTQAEAVVEGPNESTVQASLAALAWRMRMPAAATFCTGFFQAAGVLFLPLYLQTTKHVAEDDTRLVVAFTAAGMVLMSNPAGVLGDRFGHLFMLRVLALMGVVGLGALHFIEGFPVIALAIFLGGGAVAAMPPLSLALQGVITERSEYGRANSVFNFFFASGLLTGPLVAGYVFERFRGVGLLSVLVGLWACFVALSIMFRRDDPRAREAFRRGDAQG